MDTFQVTDEGDGIIRVDAETRLMRKPLAEAICADVDEHASRYGSFKILMNMGAISRGTPGAGFYTLRRMKQYDLRALALYRANAFMRGMARVVLGLAGFSNFALFDDEGEAMVWLKASEVPSRAAPARRRGPAVAALAVLGGGMAWFAARRARRPKG